MYDAEIEFKNHITQIGVDNGIYDKNGTALISDINAAPQVKGPAPVKSLAFGKIHTKWAPEIQKYSQ